MGKLSSALTDVDQTVIELRDRLNKFTKEAAEIEINLKKASETLSAAETLVSELDDEFQRWTQQVRIIQVAFCQWICKCSEKCLKRPHLLVVV